MNQYGSYMLRLLAKLFELSQSAVKYFKCDATQSYHWMKENQNLELNISNQIKAQTRLKNSQLVDFSKPVVFKKESTLLRQTQ